MVELLEAEDYINGKMKKTIQESEIEESLEPTGEQIAANAIRAMFFSKQYNKKVPVKDINVILSSKQWDRAYGSKNVVEAWKMLYKDGYVNKEGNVWVWGIKFDESQTIEEDLDMNTFIVTVKHDTGTTKIRVTAKDEKTAKEMIMKSESCPECAIKNISKVDKETSEKQISKQMKIKESKLVESAQRWLDEDEIQEASPTFLKGTHRTYDIPNTNLTVIGFGRDLNGNETIKVATPNERVRSLQTGDVFSGRTVRALYWENESPEAVKKINADIIDYVRKFEKGIRLKVNEEVTESLSVPEQHQKNIALKTLKMNKVGANVMGGMNHKQAISFLLRHGYSEDKLKQMLKGYSHSDSEIAEMFTESVDAVGKSDWTIKVLTDKNKVKETYEVKDKTEEEAKKEAMAKIKGKKELRATVSKVEKKEEIEETIKYRGYSIEPSGDNFYIKDSKGHRAFGEVPASVATAKKWIDLEIAEKGIKEIEESKLEPHYEILPASKYYGNHATGSVVLRNGKVEFHGTTAEAKELYKKMTDKKIEEAMIVDVKEEGTFFDRANKFLKEVNEIDDAGRRRYFNGEEEFETEQEVDAPNEEDCFIEDETRGGYNCSCGGKFIGNFREYDDAVIAIGDWMKKNNWSAAVWSISDHGNTELIKDFQEQYEKAKVDREDFAADNKRDEDQERWDSESRNS